MDMHYQNAGMSEKAREQKISSNHFQNATRTPSETFPFNLIKTVLAAFGVGVLIGWGFSATLQTLINARQTDLMEINKLTTLRDQEALKHLTDSLKVELANSQTKLEKCKADLIISEKQVAMDKIELANMHEKNKILTVEVEYPKSWTAFFKPWIPVLISAAIIKMIGSENLPAQMRHIPAIQN